MVDRKKCTHSKEIDILEEVVFAWNRDSKFDYIFDDDSRERERRERKDFSRIERFYSLDGWKWENKTINFTQSSSL